MTTKIWKLHMTDEKTSTDLVLCPSHQSYTAIKRICYAASIYGRILPAMENQRECGAKCNASTEKKASNMGAAGDGSGFCMSS